MIGKFSEMQNSFEEKKFNKEKLTKEDITDPMKELFSDDFEVEKDGKEDKGENSELNYDKEYSDLMGDDFETNELNEKTDIKEVAQVVKNKLDGCERENQVEQELKEKYPESEGYQVVKEAYLRDENGKFVTDPETGERRRIDFVVVKDGKVVKSVEVTSMTAPKEEQQAKEQRIREAGGNYIRDNNGDLAEFPSEIETEIERRQ